MYERFTDRARKVMQLANQEAQRFNHEYICTEHVLLGLITEGDGVAAQVIKQRGIDLRSIRVEVEKLIQRGPDVITMGRLPETPRAKKVIEYSFEEARNLKRNYLGTEHILLGLLREADGVAAQVLLNLGLKLEEVRVKMLRMKESPAPDQADKVAVAVTDLEIHLGKLFQNLLEQAGYTRRQMEQLPGALQLPEEAHVVTCGDTGVLQEYAIKRDRAAAIVRGLEDVRKALPLR